MGLGRLNPGCRQECGCSGCFGVLELLGPCKIKWAVSGDPFYVELLLDGNLVSNAEAGELNAPESGTYTLKVQCAESDGLSVIDTLVYVAPASGCSSCCQSFGPAVLLDTTIVEIEMGSPPWGWFNGSYVLNKMYQPCGGEPTRNCKHISSTCTNTGSGPLYIPNIVYPRGGPGIYGGEIGFPARCTKSRGLLGQNGYYAGNWTQSTQWGQLVYEVWYLPASLTIEVRFGDPNITDIGGQQFDIKKQHVVARATMGLFLIAIDDITKPPASRSCQLTSGSIAEIDGVIACGNSTLIKSAANYTFTPPGVFTPVIQPTVFTATVFP